MTRQAESLTIEVDGDPVIWTPRGSFLDPAERRVVLPHQFMDWFANERQQLGSRLARWLRITRWPMPISTALPIAVRLSLRGADLRRQWVAFSVVDEQLLRGFRLPDAEIQPGLVDGAVRFAFVHDESPLSTSRSITLVPCEQLSPLHWYRRRDASDRQFDLTA